MPRRPALGTTTAALCALLALTACQGSPEAGQPNTAPPPSTSDPTSSPTPSPTPSNTPEDVAVAAASVAYRGFVAATDAMYRSGGRNVTALNKYASGVMLKAELVEAEKFRGYKWHSVGSLQVVWIKPLSIGKPNASGQIDSLILSACVDSSKAGAVDSKGKSVRLPGTPNQTVDEMRMRRVQGSWKADFAQSRKPTKC
ncbi:hypothetical protein EV647_4736 [Kribbella sp. VKM Ac-2566]|nr:hypothetical protein EV647_4736 [Kribbella sp. VKM Ac-2566]